MRLDKRNIGIVEHNIAPPLREAITLPVIINGKPTGVAVYVGSTPFMRVDNSALVEAVAERLAIDITDDTR